jgi:hypothetical protein
MTERYKNPVKYQYGHNYLTTIWLPRPAPLRMSNIRRTRKKMLIAFCGTLSVKTRIRKTTAMTSRIMEMMLIIVGFLIYASKGGPKKRAE